MADVSARSVSREMQQQRASVLQWGQQRSVEGCAVDKGSSRRVTLRWAQGSEFANNVGGTACVNAMASSECECRVDGCSAVALLWLLLWCVAVSLRSRPPAGSDRLDADRDALAIATRAATKGQRRKTDAHTARTHVSLCLSASACVSVERTRGGQGTVLRRCQHRTNWRLRAPHPLLQCGPLWLRGVVCVVRSGLLSPKPLASERDEITK